MRVLAWNIRAGGGRRVAGILAQIEAWSPDLIALSEFRGTPPGRELRAALGEVGYGHLLETTVLESPARNALLLASRWPLQRVRLQGAPEQQERWLCAEASGPERFTLIAVHFPNEVTGRKWPYMEAVAALAERWRRGPALILGDTNSGRPGIDEENAVFGRRYTAWFDRMEAAGWRDAFRALYPDQREFTWYSPNGGNGFRIDQAFANRAMMRRVVDVRHAWGGPGERRDELSDHAALIIDTGARP
ncbi:MAG: endonuclease/exonuclease/phosphatase family protein [Dehalococcoidia bacterium]